MEALLQDPDERLKQIANDIRQGAGSKSLTVRELLSWFGVQRRGYSIVLSIREALDKAGLATVPDFQGAFIDGEVALVGQTPATRVAAAEEEKKASDPERDPTYRIGKLASANTKPVCVCPDDTVAKAITLMLSNDYSQLPVMIGEREVKGVISWSSLGSRLALEKPCQRVRECMEPHREISSDISLFEAIGRIVQHQYVLIRSSDKRISGIVTTSDLSLQFQQLGEPFLLIGEIENYIRRMIRHFSIEELGAAKDPADRGREIATVSDLTFGEYRRLLEHPERWLKLELPIDRAEFIQKLDKVRRIRNDVMHFDSDGIADPDLKVLRDFVRFLQRLAQLDAI